MEEKKAYYEEDWTPESDLYEGYRLLKGPENFECCLTEPEDRCWSRDLAPVVDRLNKQHTRIAELEAWQKEALPFLQIELAATLMKAERMGHTSPLALFGREMGHAGSVALLGKANVQILEALIKQAKETGDE